MECAVRTGSVDFSTMTFGPFATLPMFRAASSQFYDKHGGLDTSWSLILNKNRFMWTRYFLFSSTYTDKNMKKKKKKHGGLDILILKQEPTSVDSIFPGLSHEKGNWIPCSRERVHRRFDEMKNTFNKHFRYVADVSRGALPVLRQTWRKPPRSRETKKICVSKHCSGAALCTNTQQESSSVDSIFLGIRARKSTEFTLASAYTDDQRRTKKVHTGEWKICSTSIFATLPTVWSQFYGKHGGSHRDCERLKNMCSEPTFYANTQQEPSFVDSIFLGIRTRKSIEFTIASTCTDDPTRHKESETETKYIRLLLHPDSGNKERWLCLLWVRAIYISASNTILNCQHWSWESTFRIKALKRSIHHSWG